jgi:hypothetical protein
MTPQGKSMFFSARHLLVEGLLHAKELILVNPKNERRALSL